MVIQLLIRKFDLKFIRFDFDGRVFRNEVYEVG